MLLSRGSFLRLIINKSIMHNLELLCQQYKAFLSPKITSKPQTLLREFKKFVENLGKIDVSNPPKLKYHSSHLQFLLRTLSEPSPPQQLSFTVLIQIANITLRTSSNPRIIIPDSLIAVLAHRMSQNQEYRKSPSLVSNVIWLVMRCLSLSFDRQALLRRVSQSKLLGECLKCPLLEGMTQKGIGMLLSYMSKNHIIDEEFTLSIIAHLPKFTQTDAIRDVLGLLRRLNLDKVKNQKQLLPQLTSFTIAYMSNPAIQWQEKVENWKYLFSVAHLNKSNCLGPLCIDPLLKTLIDQAPQEIEEEVLNKVYDVSCSLIKKTHQEQVYLAAAAQHITTNPIARRIFIRHHEKITPELYLDILSGWLPEQLSQGLMRSTEKETALKLLICLKRSSSLLGLDRFFSYKFKDATVYLRQENLSAFHGELIDLWKEVSKEE